MTYFSNRLKFYLSIDLNFSKWVQRTVFCRALIDLKLISYTAIQAMVTDSFVPFLCILFSCSHSKRVRSQSSNSQFLTSLGIRPAQSKHFKRIAFRRLMFNILLPSIT